MLSDPTTYMAKSGMDSCEGMVSIVPPRHDGAMLSHDLWQSKPHSEKWGRRRGYCICIWGQMIREMIWAQTKGKDLDNGLYIRKMCTSITFTWAVQSLATKTPLRWKRDQCISYIEGEEKTERERERERERKREKGERKAGRIESKWEYISSPWAISQHHILRKAWSRLHRRQEG